ncbi:lipopolysaccharide biosynthesis protein [Altererythrobacter sp. CAU 1778]
MAAKVSRRKQPETLLGRMFSNLAWLAGGKGFGAVCSLVYLAILTRSLGLKEFGHFSLIFGTSQALIALTGFDTWRTVVKYGAEHVHKQNWGALGRLGTLAGLLDAIGAMIGCVIAYVAIYQFGDVLDLNPQLVDTAFWFNVAALWALVSAPTGIVRALDRFDMAIYVEAIVPIGRLAAAAAIWLTGPSLGKFLIAWAVIDLLEAAIYWAMAKYLCPDAVRLSYLRDVRTTLQENEGVVRFFGITYASATLNAAFKHGPLLAVGYFVGTKAAGLYRLAQQLAQGLGKLSTLLTRAVYTEIARARVSSDVHEFRKLAIQTTRIAGAAGAVVVAAVVAGGGYLMELLGGEDFRGGYIILIPLTLAASFELASVAFEPVLHATGRARYSLLARLVAVVALFAMLLLTTGGGVSAAAWSVSFGAAVGYLALGTLAWWTLRQMEAGTIDQKDTA